MRKLLKEKYKTYSGALKRAQFENALAHGEHRRGRKAKLYRYTVVLDAAQAFRVAREVAK